MTFVGRTTELEQFQLFLGGNDNNPWVMIITGMECIGKSALLEQMQTHQPEETLYVPLDFAVETLQDDIFHFNILEKLAEAISSYSDAQRFAAFEAQLDQARQYMADLNLRSVQPNTQSIFADHSTVTHVAMSNDAREYIDRGRSINVDILKTALRRQLRTFTQKRLVILLDNFEWLSQQTGSQFQGQLPADHWLVNTLLPELHDYLHPSQLFVIITTRVRPYFDAIKKDDLYYIPLHMLNREEVQQYLENTRLPLAWLSTIYEATMGHALCITLFHEVLREQYEGILDPQSESAEQTHIVSLFYERAWHEFVHERILSRLATPFNHLLRYSVIPDTFNLPLLRYVFPELWTVSGSQDAEMQDSQIRKIFEQLLLYPCISQDTRSSQQDYAIHPLVRTILLKHLENHEQERLSNYQQLVNDYKQKIR